MTQNLFGRLSQKPIVFIFASPDGLGLSMVESLLAKFCQVKVITSRVNNWIEKTKPLSENRNLEILPISKEFKWSSALGYMIVINSGLDRSLKEIQKANELSSTLTGKKFLVLPYHFLDGGQKDQILAMKEQFVCKCPDIQIFYLGDVLGPMVKDSEVNSTYLVLRRYLVENETPQSLDEYVYPVLTKDVAKVIARQLFSFGPSENEVSLIGNKMSISSLIDILQKQGQIKKIRGSYNLRRRNSFQNVEELLVESNIGFAVKQTMLWLEKNPPKKRVRKKKAINVVKKSFNIKKVNFKIKFKKRKKVVVKKTKISTKGLYLSLVGLLLIIISPFLILSTSGLSLYLCAKAVQKGKISFASYLLGYVSGSSNLVEKQSRIYTGVPLLGNIYRRWADISAVTKKASDVSLDLINIYKKLSILPARIVGDEIYTLDPIIDDASLELEVIYQELGFIQSEIGSLGPATQGIIYKYLSKERLTDFREKIFFAKVLVENLNKILGVGKAQTYLVLFQNNMELRPTGGFIGSFALISFENGRMVDINVQDVYSADGQLKGYVKPPEPIHKYLGEVGWWLRDSNWDPDFPKSAIKAEWFLDKEIDQLVDGTIAIDLELAREVLKITGPIYLTDFDRQLDHLNLYEITQAEVEEDFFPGSRKKSNFLTALSREMINTINARLGNNEMGLLVAFVKALEEKHIQIYLHDDSIQEAISKFGYQGEVKVPYCQGNCYHDFVSYVDANLGVNKANYFIKRSVFLNIIFDGESIKRSLKIVYENSANPVLGEKARYKTYIRALVDKESIFGDVKILSTGEQDFKKPDINLIDDYKEAGVFVQINPGQTKTVEFVWSNKLENNIDFYQRGEYGVFFRKQAGLVDDYLSINLKLPDTVRTLKNSSFILTNEGNYVYNTLLTRDVFPLIYWY